MLIDKPYAATLAASRDLRTDLCAALTARELAEQRVNDLLLAVTELFTNIVRHGDPVASAVTLRVTEADQGLEVALEDDGGHFDGLQAALSNAGDPASEPLSEGGMGLGLIAMLIGSVSYTRHGGRNRLAFVEPVPKRRGPTVAVIDDDTVSRTLAASFLKDGYHVQTFGDAREALAAIKQDPPDLIISDIAMPEMDGLELRGELRRDDRTALIPFVFLTGLNDESLEERASSLEIDDFLEKPVSKTRLRNAADRVLRRSRGLREMLQSSVDRRITDALRTPVPDRSGPWSIAGLEQAVTPGGGDLVLHRRGDGWTTLLVLDVMGHGVSAKIFAFAYAGYVQSLLNDDATATRPDALVQALSERIAADDRFAETIVTCAVAHLRDDGAATLAVAGHPRPLLGRVGTPWRPVPISGGMPGLSLEPPEVRTVILERGDALLLVTDGLGESLSFDHPETALLEVLEGARQRGDAPLPVLAAATRHATDDRTAILVRHDGAGGVS